MPAAKRLLVPLVVAALALAIAAPALSGNLLFFDDGDYVTRNPILRMDFVDAFARSFSEPYFYNYHPLHLLSYWLDYQIWGLEPFGYRLTSALLYALGAVLVWGLGRRLAGPRAALLGAVLFAVHPFHVEAVAWVSGRKDLLCLVFALAALAAWLRWVERGGWGRYAAALLFHALALLSKSAAVMLPGLAYLLLLLQPERRPRWRFAAALLPFVALAGAQVALEMHAHGESGAIVEWPGGSLTTALFTQARIELGYFVRMLVPWPLAPVHDVDPSLSAADPRFLAAAAALIALAIAAVALWRRTRWPAFALLWVALAAAPTSNLVPLSIPYADRWLMLGTVGGCLAIGVGLAALAGWLARRVPRWAAFAPAGLYAAGLLAASLDYARDWRDDDALWARAIRHAPGSYQAQVNHGASLLRARRFDEAGRHYARALELEPRSYVAMSSLALSWAMTAPVPRGESAEVLRTLARVLDDPRRAAAFAEEIVERAAPVAAALAQRAHRLAPEDPAVKAGFDRVRAAVERRASR
jgi:tetratricopeptide (TPR) repeat protein